MNLNRICFLGISLCGAVALWGCDLQPKIASIPDSIGDFISTRYPALLADPEKEPEIYNSAVTDYGVYASPELYGSGNIDDYVLYASVDDYVLTPNDEKPEPKIVEATPKKSEEVKIVTPAEPEIEDYLSVPKYVQPAPMKEVEKIDADVIVVARGDTLYSIARGNNTTVSELARINSLTEPYTLRVGQKLKLKPDTNKAPEEPKEITKIKETPSQPIVKPIEHAKSVQPVEVKPNNTKRVAVQEIAVAPGDTLYSLSRKYEIPVNDLAVMNKISSPFTLSVGQKLKVPKLDTVETKSNSEIKQIKSDASVKKVEPKKAPEKKDAVTNKKTDQKNAQKKSEKKSQAVPMPGAKSKQNAQSTKTSSGVQKQSLKIAARSASKFSWPVRGKILSQYGAKKGGLFNDGINISANLGTAVKAAENGVVAYAGNEVKGMGNLVIIQHSDGWMTVYAHLDSMSVRRGTKVVVGQQIGKIGKTGKVDTPQLHFEIRKGTKAYNPITYLKK